ncbi:carbon storage regulator [Bremerella cremea]|uniref:carbon storage regulator n=1 Tax=Bremerella cremea TaxID=1031537 RepID=UPI0031EEC656
MLVLSRKVGDSIKIGDNIEIVINRISGNRVTIGVEAPKDVRILRGEVEVDLDDHSDAVLALSGLLSAAQIDYSHSAS